MGGNTWMTRFTLALLCVSASALSACGGGDGGGALPAPPPPSTLIGPAGGTVSGPNSAQVAVPAGALAANTPIAVDQSSAGSPVLPVGMNPLGAMYAFTPHGTTFAAPVTITVPYNAASLPAGAAPALYKTNAAGAWERVPNAAVNAGTLTAQVTGFSWLLVANVPPQITTQPANAAVVEPATATFNVTAIGVPPFTYQWQRSDDAGMSFNNIAGATASSYTTAATAVAVDNGDRYRVLVSNSEGSSISSSATLTVTAVVVAPSITTQPQNVSVAVGANASFSVVAIGTNLVYQWQKNGIPLLGQTNASLNLTNVQSTDAGSYTVVVSNLVNAVPVNSVTSNTALLTVTTPPAATGARIAAGSDFSFARRANGDLYSWGSDSAGTLGTGNGDQTRSIPGFLPASNVANIAAGAAHGLFTRGTGDVRTWGYNGFGQLGDGTNLTREAPVQPTVDTAGTTVFSDAVEVCGGSLHSLVRRSNGLVRAMGAHNFGQLGDGTPADLVGRLRTVAVSGITNATAIACRGNHSLALLADGTVRAWGANSAGQLGDGTTTDRNVPVVVTGLTNVIAIAAGNDYSLALRSDGSVWAWGSNVNGKLGDGTTSNRLTPTATLLTSGITAIAAGFMNSVALRGADGVVLSWGINETGQLGSGTLSPGFRPQPAPVINLSSVVAISFGSGALGHGLAVRADGTVWAWGDNQMGTDNNGNRIFGRLGNGSTVPFSATPVQVTGLNLN